MLRHNELWEKAPREHAGFVSTVALLGLEGWSLRPYSLAIGRLSYLSNPARFAETSDFVLAKPLSFSLAEVREHPERCGFRLTQRIYEAFGYSAKEMPAEYDQARDRLVLPS